MPKYEAFNLQKCNIEGHSFARGTLTTQIETFHSEKSCAPPCIDRNLTTRFCLQGIKLVLVLDE